MDTGAGEDKQHQLEAAHCGAHEFRCSCLLDVLEHWSCAIDFAIEECREVGHSGSILAMPVGSASWLRSRGWGDDTTDEG